MGQKLELNKHLFYYFRMEGVYVEHFTLGLANARPAVIWPYGTAYLFLAISSLPSAGFPLWVN